jgi:hypothetical protein
MYFNSLSVPLKIVPRATLGTRAVGCRRLFYAVKRDRNGRNIIATLNCEDAEHESTFFNGAKVINGSENEKK